MMNNCNYYFNYLEYVLQHRGVVRLVQPEVKMKETIIMDEYFEQKKNFTIKVPAISSSKLAFINLPEHGHAGPVPLQVTLVGGEGSIAEVEEGQRTRGLGEANILQ